MLVDKFFLKTLMVALGMLTFNAHGLNIDESSIAASVGKISWNKQTKIEYEKIVNLPIPKNMVNLIFIRQTDVDKLQSSLNIAINNSYQTSLHPNNYSQVLACSGINKISAVTTDKKTNDLLQDALTLPLKAGETYFLYFEVADDRSVTIQQVPKASALALLQNKNYQAHQISRLVPDCPNPPPAILPVTQTPLPINKIITSKLEEKVSLQVKILFDSDQAVIKPQYFKEVAQLAAFLQHYQEASAIIEGHTDSTASADYNLKLSKQRAQAVVYTLTNTYGVNGQRLTAIGLGEASPIANNSTKEGRERNRRVIAVVEQE